MPLTPATFQSEPIPTLFRLQQFFHPECCVSNNLVFEKVGITKHLNRDDV